MINDEANDSKFEKEWSKSDFLDFFKGKRLMPEDSRKPPSLE